LPELLEVFRDGRFRDRDVTVRGQAIAGYAMAKLGLPEALDTVVRVLDSRTTEAPVRRSAAIAAGALAPLADEKGRNAAVRSLQKAAERAKDPTSRNFALISLGRIGTPECDGTLLRAAENARYGQRPFAAIALGTMVWYRDRAAEAGETASMDDARRERIIASLARLSERFRDSDTRAAFLLARGLVRDPDAVAPLLDVVCARGSDPVLRGFACTALGLIGDARPEVRDALVLSVRDRRSVDLRKQASTALALLRDGAVLDVLLQELREAKSFAVQGQLIQAIGTLGDARAVPDLVTLLDDKSQPALLRAMAAVGLGMIGDPRVVPALSRLSRDYNYRASVPDLDELLFIL
jgi:HEAT repeat protein